MKILKIFGIQPDQTVIRFSFEFSDARNETDKGYRSETASIRASKCWNAPRLHYYGFAFNFRRRFRNQIIISQKFINKNI